jgi:hypothetical protein
VTGWTHRAIAVCAFGGFGFGCAVDYAIKAADSVPRAISESSRASSVASWTGRYVFSECASQQVCWSYEIVVDGSGDATVRADGADLAIHVNAKPEVDGAALRLPFDSYIDGNPEPTVHLPFSKPKGFRRGEVLGRIGRSATGGWCLAFAGLRSPRATKILCQ